MRIFPLALPVGVLFLSAAAPQTPAPHLPDPEESLTVRVEGIRDIPGELGVAVFSAKRGYPTHLEHAYENLWFKLEPGQKTATLVFDNLAPGEYAVSVLHDSIPNRKVDRSAVGFPKEGVGFSNGQKVTLKAPSYAKSKFTLMGGEHKVISITLEYRN